MDGIERTEQKRQGVEPYRIVRHYRISSEALKRMAGIPPKEKISDVDWRMGNFRIGTEEETEESQFCGDRQ